MLVSLACDSPVGAGKTTASTDTSRGRLVRLAALVEGGAVSGG